MNRSTIMVAGVVAALALFSGGYFVGANTAKPAASPTAAVTGGAGGGAGGAGNVRGPGGNAGGGGGNGPVNGRVISVNADSITIALTEGRPGASAAPGASPATSSAIALVGGTTKVVKTTETDVKLSDLKAGDQVTVVGTTDAATGTISAQTIVVGGLNIGQLFGGGGAGGGANPRASASPSPR